MADLADWAQEFSTFPMRRQGEFDGACGLYCIIAIATWWADKKAPGVVDPEESGYLAGALPGDLFNKHVLSARGLHHKARRAIAANLGLDLRVPKGGFTKDTILDHFRSNSAPLIVTARMRFRDPLRRVDESEDRHAVVVVSARPAGLIIADPHPWNNRFSKWSWPTFVNRVSANKQGRWWVERVTPNST